MIHNRNRFLSLLLVIALCLTLLPAVALAEPVWPGGPDQTFYVGQTLARGGFIITADSGGRLGYNALTSSLPPGLIQSFPNPQQVEIWGTVQAGNVGVTYYKIDCTDIGDGLPATISINIAKGPQTTVQPDVIWNTNSGTVQLKPYSINMSGAKISGTDDPTPYYTYSGGDPQIATIDVNGLVTVHGWGVTQFSIQSGATASYEAAAEKTFTFTVAELPAPPTGGSNPPTIPQTGDSNHPAGWTAALLISLAGLTALLIQRKRQGRKNAK